MDVMSIRNNRRRKKAGEGRRRGEVEMKWISSRGGKRE
jgi:hypothetical protein